VRAIMMASSSVPGRHVRTQRLAYTYQEELNLVCLCDGCVTTGQGHEFLGKLVDGALATKERQFTNQTPCERWLKAFVDQLDKSVAMAADQR
jgi:hypothetical protein